MPELDLDMWLQAEDVEPEAEIVFADEGRKGFIPGKENDPEGETFEIGVTLPDGSKRLWTMNKTSQRAVARAYTTKTSLWVGKKCPVFTTTQNVGGQMKKCIYARVPK